MGKKKKRMPVWLAAACAVIVVAILAVLVYALSSGGGNGSAARAEYKVGQDIDLDGIRLNIIRAYESRGTDSERPELRNVFTVARVLVQNATAGPVTVKPDDFALLLDGKELPLRTLGYVFDGLVEKTLEPGAGIEGALSWETPARFRTKILVYTGPSGTKAAVDLQASVE
ncbi:MAG: hypothetical protein ACM3X6_05535 [Patescibacteria group bacterium]